jgi:hypothetical protein
MTDVDVATIAKLQEEKKKLELEARKIRKELFWYPVGIAASIMGATATLTGAVIAIAVLILK